MATIEVEKRIQQLDPEHLKELLNYLDYLLFLQKKQAPKHGNAEQPASDKTIAASENPEEENIPERLRTLQQFKAIAPKPHFPVSKYDVYDQ